MENPTARKGGGEMTLEEIAENRKALKAAKRTMEPWQVELVRECLDAAERSLKLEAENKILKEALEKYANSQNWMHENGDNIFKVDEPMQYGVTVSYIEYELASDVLEKLK